MSTDSNLEKSFTLLDRAAALLGNLAAACGMSMTSLDSLARKMPALETAIMRGVITRGVRGARIDAMASTPSAQVPSSGLPQAGE
ncbi:hypothetical protein J2848_002528 [Azospirillum lipoferum]|uniref:Uncharacterized protein n=1 Tax=Azospirillum lipoferum TaxID=193 RepID=A0A5A9GNC4_AZOLI|nr:MULTISPECIES: hypothetical protein [Azospirillum]KAA0595958.1 hypothetical protein FZ942_12120 [Azospirillum lipoferum]MCP1610855.1 hypothetical protein [Azospirillum lipoferum]MDW5533997.1 hypothetical protein [Azospirillum sp. NL1]